MQRITHSLYCRPLQ